MRRYAYSIGYAMNGLGCALRTEHNLKLFVASYAASIVLSAFLHLHASDWMFVLLSGGTFLSVEILNTAIERFAGAFNTHTRSQQDDHDSVVGMTKDIAAGAALVSALTWVVILAIIFLPYFRFSAVGTV
jgi:diacylglycerol kinase